MPFFVGLLCILFPLVQHNLLAARGFIDYALPSRMADGIGDLVFSFRPLPP